MKVNENEILTIAGKRVRVAYAEKASKSCEKCCFHNDNDEVACKAVSWGHGWPCKIYHTTAYFVPAEESKTLTKLREFLDTATPEELDAKYRELEYLLVPKDNETEQFVKGVVIDAMVEEFEENNAANIASYKHYPDSPSTGQFGTGDYQPEEDNSMDREVFVKGFKEGIAWERERIIKKLRNSTIEEGYMARDEKGCLIYSTQKLERDWDQERSDGYWYPEDGDGSDVLCLPSELFPEVRWADKPKKVKLIILKV